MDFKNATIGGQVVFEGKFPDKDFVADFRWLKFKDQGVMCFQDISLARGMFEGTDMRRLELHHITWHRLRGGRQALYDEVLLTHREREQNFFKMLIHFNTWRTSSGNQISDDYSMVERLYRNLVVNYENENDFKGSGDFHYGEMEMHRRASGLRWFPLYWYNIYSLSSGYGERPLRAMLALLGLILVFSGLFLALEGKFLSSCTWSNYWQSLLYVFQQGTLQKPDWLRPCTMVGKFLSALMPVLIPGQTALFFLALRNRLGRRH